MSGTSFNKLYNNITPVKGCQDPALPPCTCLRGCESAPQFEPSGESVLEREAKARRFYIKCRDGIWIAQERGYPVRWFTLSESDYALGMGLDFGRAVHQFERDLRRKYGRDVGFCWVEHLQGDKQRSNRHFIEWGTKKLDSGWLDTAWHRLYGSKVTGLGKVMHAGKTANYLARYVAGEGFVKARFSYNWVFPRWFEFSKWFKRQYSDYPDVIELAKLSVMSPVERVGVPVYYDWLLSQQDRVKRRLADKVLGLSSIEQKWLDDYRKKHHRRCKNGS